MLYLKPFRRLLSARFRQALARGGALALAVICLLGPLQAQASLMLTPTRVVFDKNMRSSFVELINNGADTTTYRISLVDMKMTATGSLQAAATTVGGEVAIERYIRFSPRQVTLKPGESQVVRLLLRKPPGLADGEYRSHLKFEPVPPTEGSTSIEPAKAADKKISIAITPLVAVTIPVIIRHGQTYASAELAELAVQPPAKAGADPVLAMTLGRSGNRSLYGDMTVTHTPPGGQPRAIGKAHGIAVYVPLRSRKVEVPLAGAGQQRLRGVLRVTYNERPEDGGKLISEATLSLP